MKRHIFGAEEHPVDANSIWHDRYALCGRTIRKVDIEADAPLCKTCLQKDKSGYRNDARWAACNTPSPLTMEQAGAIADVVYDKVLTDVMRLLWHEDDPALDSAISLIQREFRVELEP